MKGQKITSLQAIENINSCLHNSGLDKESLDNAKADIKALGEAQGLTSEEAMLVAAIIESAADGYSTRNDIANFLGCSNVQMYIYSPVLASLTEKGCIRAYQSRRRSLMYEPSKEFLSAVVDNRKFEKRDLSNLSLCEFLQVFTEYTDDRHDNDREFSGFINDVRDLIKSNQSLPVCQLIASLYPEKKLYTDIVSLYILRACALACMYDRFSFTKLECQSLFENENDQTWLLRQLNSSRSAIAASHIFEPAITQVNPLADNDRLALTEEFCKKYLKGVNINRRKEKAEVSEGTILCSSIVEKKLFYNADEAGQIEELSKLLKPRNFARIQKQLKEYGYRNGFACLFHGAPGTGKTESAMQLARMTGRNIIPVDLSQIRDKYVGESEKRTKAIFDDYRDELKRSKVAPILLLNEADGLLSQRLSNIGDSVDQMANTMQNIILQEMENFEGILIATTNLTCNLDSAFERRFLYKVEFHRPSAEARQSIWSSMIRDLEPADAQSLAEQFDFSGGEIENIARKYVVNNILHNKKTDVESLRQICRTEKISTKGERKRVGF